MLEDLQKLVLTKQKILTEPKSFINIIKIHRIDRKMKRMAKKYAKQQAENMYKQAYSLFNQIIEANFQ